MNAPFLKDFDALFPRRDTPPPDVEGVAWWFYLPLILFVALDTLGLKLPRAMQFAAAVGSYLFLAWLAAKNVRRGVLCYLVFSLLSIRLSNLGKGGEALSTFAELRFGSVTVNFLFGIALAFVAWRTFPSTWKRPLAGKFLLLLLLSWGVLNGLLLSMVGVNYFGYFLSDLFRYSPIAVYLVLVLSLDADEMGKLMVGYVVGTLFLTVLSLGLGIYRTYGTLGNQFLLQNSGNKIFFPMLLLMGLHKRNCRWMLLAAAFYGFLILRGKTFVSGKESVFIFLFLPFFLLSALPNQKFWKGGALLFALAIFPFLAMVATWVRDSMAQTGHAYVAKFSYLLKLLTDFDYRAMAGDITLGSLANLVGEGLTLAENLFGNAYYAVFGKGFGGALHDSFAYLWLDAGSGGYPAEAAALDAYLTLHIALFCIVLKLGLAGFVADLFLSARLFFSRSPFAALAFLVLLTYMMATKESSLLCVVLLRCATLDDPPLAHGDLHGKLRHGCKKTLVH